MKLTKLIIKNFRGLKGENNVISFDDSNIIFLIGQNNVGKSSFLHAYCFFTNSKQKAQKEDFYNYDTEIPIEIIGEFEKEEADSENTDFSKDPDWMSKWVTSNNKIIIKKVWNSIEGAFKKYTFNPATNEFVVNGFGGLDTLFTKYAPTPIFINAIETEESLEKKVNEIIDKEYLKRIETIFNKEYLKAVSSINTLQDKITNSNNITIYNKRINLNFQKIFPELSLKISQKKSENIDIIKAFKTNHSIAVQREGVTRQENFSQHGHGIIRQALFNFLVFMKNESASNIKNYIILFEEPELYLHPKSTFLLREELYNIAEDSPFQILCATHSPKMIDISKPHSSLVRITKDLSEETKTYQVGHSVFQADENKDFVQMINRFNPNVCETFYANEVVLVEGDTEAIIIREIIKKNFNDKDIFILNTGSKNNIPFFQKILTHFSIKQHIIHDSDTRYLYEKDSNDNLKVKLTNKLEKRKNSAWKINENIWNEVINSNRKEEGLSKRYVSIYNFESANNYEYDFEKGKPLSAFEFGKTINIENDISIIKFIKQIVGETEYENIFTNDLLNSKVKEPI